MKWPSASSALSSAKAPSTLIRFQTKTELFCSGYGYRPHYNAENGAIRKRSPEWSDLKTVFSSVDGENDGIWKRWRHQNKQGQAPNHSTVEYPKWQTHATMWLQFHANLRADILKCACVDFIWPCALRHNSVFKQIRRCSVDGRKRYENDKCGPRSFWKRSKTAAFSFENGLVWTGPNFSYLYLKLWNPGYQTELFCVTFYNFLCLILAYLLCCSRLISVLLNFFFIFLLLSD